MTELTEENADTDDAKARMQDNPMKNLILLTTVRVYQEKNWRGGRVQVGVNTNNMRGPPRSCRSIRDTIALLS